jgi:ankyrin repeat protein
MGGHFVLAQLCMQTDFNVNTPIHLASQNNSFDLLKLINPICIKHSQLIYNEDGLNPFLLASRHSSIQFIEYLIDQSSFDFPTARIDVNLLNSKDKVYSKNCLHYACGRGCGKDALNVIRYLTGLAEQLDNSNFDINNNNTSNSRPVLFELIGSVSPLVGSIYHVAASNLTRLTSLWYLLGLYPANGLFIR